MSPEDPKFPPVEEQLAQLRQGTVDLVTLDGLRGKLKRSLTRGQPLVVKVGFDPTAPDIHLGHTVLLRKMRQFQELGHRVIFVIGDFTAMIGDPSGKSKTRPALTREQILENAESYTSQCYKLLDRKRTEIRFNREWLGELGAEGIVRLAARYNVARMLERNDFKKRFQAGQSISMHEFLYPLAQAYDSVHLAADVELGGTDQLFNLNVGRDVMPGYDLEPQVVMTTPLLEGLDGTDKMSKSLDNYVGIDEEPRQIFGKLMSIRDDLMWRYYELCTDISPEGLAQMKRLVEEGSLHPKKAKEGLALRIISDFHDEAAAQDAREEFERVFRDKGVPDDLPRHRVSAGDGKIFLPVLLSDLGLAASRGEARRLLSQGAVSIDDERVATDCLELLVEAGTQRRFKVGRRRFALVTFE